MRTLIVYYSYSGNNEALAKELGKRFGCDIVRIEEQKRRTDVTILFDLLFIRDSQIFDPNVYLDEYEIVIFIAPIWDSKIATPLCSYLKKERKNINSYAFITVCGGREGQKKKINDHLTQLVGKAPITVTELEISHLLSEDQKSKVNLPTSYKVSNDDFNVFKRQIQDFVNAVFQYSIEVAEKKSPVEA